MSFQAISLGYPAQSPPSYEDTPGGSRRIAPSPHDPGGAFSPPQQVSSKTLAVQSACGKLNPEPEGTILPISNGISGFMDRTIEPNRRYVRDHSVLLLSEDFSIFTIPSKKIGCASNLKT